MASVSSLEASESQSTQLRPAEVAKLSHTEPMVSISECSSNINDTDEADGHVLGPRLPPIPAHFSLPTCYFYCFTSTVLSTFFLIFYVLLGALLKSIPMLGWTLWSWCQLKDPHRKRPFYEDEKRRKHIIAGKLKCDIDYYANQVGLECHETKIETEDGFILTMQHIIDIRPEAIDPSRKYPVLLLHGLLQASGTFCVNDDSSLAFFLCKSGYDVWLGNNRGYFNPEHQTLKPSDSRFWSWNLQQMGCLDLPAMVSYVRKQTGQEKIALVAHSQGAALTFLALSKDQVPQLGRNLSCFVALTPAVYAATLLRSLQFSFVRIMSERLYRLCFGIHSFIPFMLVMHAFTPGPIYGWLGYRVFNFLFAWSDTNWELRLRSRFFQFSPVYVSAECMRWWLGKDGFVKKKCLLPDTETRWYNPMLMPPVSLYVGGRDKLVDGRKLIERFKNVEKNILVMRSQVDEDYEHLDCLWSMDCIERIGEKVREDIWFTVAGKEFVVPEGCYEEDRGRLIVLEEYVDGNHL